MYDDHTLITNNNNLVTIFKHIWGYFIISILHYNINNNLRIVNNNKDKQ